MIKKIKKIALLFVTVLILQACSSSQSTISEEEVNKIISEIKLDSIEKMEFSIKNNTLGLYVNEEFISNGDADKLLENISVGTKVGKEALKSSNFVNKDFKINIISNINENTIEIDTAQPENAKINLKTTKYSSAYITGNLKKISTNIIKFNDLAGRIEIDIKQGNYNAARYADFKVAYDDLTKKIKLFDNIDVNNTSIDNIVVVKEKLITVTNNINAVNVAVENAVQTNQSNFIYNSFLNVNDLDKIAREFATK